MKEEIIEIKNTLKELVAKLDKLVPDETNDKEYEDWYVIRMNILLGILEEGGSVSRKKFHEIVKENRMDTRGVGGFFIRSNPSLTAFESTDGERVGLTKKGKDSAEIWAEEKKNLEEKETE